MTEALLDRAELVVTKLQAQALADLLWEGKLTGTTLADVEPPARVALLAIGDAEAVRGALERNRDGSHRVIGDRVLTVDYPPHHTLGVVADDGRAWVIVRAGICWPAEHSVRRDVQDGDTPARDSCALSQDRSR